MKVFKFGGASIETVTRARHVADIIAEYSSDSLLVVISAKGKTTNALERIAQQYFANASADAQQLFDQLKNDHDSFARELLNDQYDELLEKLQALYLEIEWILNDNPVRSYDYYYDQIVSIGELLSTQIIAAYLNQKRKCCTWVDVRDVMKTDSNYRDANIDWNATQQLTNSLIKPLFQQTPVVITQGFIGSTDENNSVTLGREGSDYTAAVFASLCQAESVTIWKDVPSLLNADPKIFPNTVPIEEITFHEVIEMAYYGAQVIHPKTIKP